MRNRLKAAAIVVLIALAFWAGDQPPNSGFFTSSFSHIK